MFTLSSMLIDLNALMCYCRGVFQSFITNHYIICIYRDILGLDLRYFCSFLLFNLLFIFDQTVYNKELGCANIVVQWQLGSTLSEGT